MRTRLASLIIVKQEPLSNEYLDSEQDVNGYNDVESQFYGSHERREHFHDIGDLNNNQDFDEDKKCMYFCFDLIFICFYDFSFQYFVFDVVRWCILEFQNFVP